MNEMKTPVFGFDASKKFPFQYGKDHLQRFSSTAILIGLMQGSILFSAISR
jgi:hypothetical protein